MMRHDLDPYAERILGLCAELHYFLSFEASDTWSPLYAALSHALDLHPRAAVDAAVEVAISRTTATWSAAADK